MNLNLSATPSSSAAGERPARAQEAVSQPSSDAFVPPPSERAARPELGALNDALARAWLAWQCRSIAGIDSGYLFALEDDGEVAQSPVCWPSRSGDSAGERPDSERSDAAGRDAERPNSQWLRATAKRTTSELSGVLSPNQPPGVAAGARCDVVGCPLLVSGVPVAAIVVVMSPRSESQQRAVLQLLQWGAAWADVLLQPRHAGRAEQSAALLEVVSKALGEPSARAATSAVADALADHLACERVSVGLRRGLQIRLAALSHVARFDPRTDLARAIEAAMEEALDQATVVVVPGDPARAPYVCKAHNRLAGREPAAAVCTVPLSATAGPIGAITLERRAAQPFDAQSIATCRAAAAIIAPALELRLRDERPLHATVLERLRARARVVFGRHHLKPKLVGLAAVAILTGLSVSNGEYRVTAPATVEGAEQRAIVAPLAGYVSHAAVRAGDLVSKGDVLASLDDRDLRLERQKWLSEREKQVKARHEALAKHERTELGLLRARIDQAEAELRLVDEQIARTQLRAPFDGVVVSGDLSQSLGAPVDTGRVLFVVAPLKNYRVVLEVDEHDIAALEPGQAGHLLMAAKPHDPLGITVERVTPVAVAAEGGNYFRVEAILDSSAEGLRPGMRGVSKVHAGARNLLWIYTHSVVDKLRLWAWWLGL